MNALWGGCVHMQASSQKLINEADDKTLMGEDNFGF
jgi:hypothetical protein